MRRAAALPLLLAACVRPATAVWIEPGVREAAHDDGDVATLVLLAEDGDVDAVLGCARVEAVRRYRNLPVVQVRADVAALDRIAACDGVEALTLDHRFHLALSQSIPLVEADTARVRIGEDGAGTAVAIIDTGLTETQAQVSGKMVYGYDHADGDADVDDCHGHGTNVAAIAAGTSGVAPGADLVVFKVFSDDSCTVSTEADIAAALDDVVTYASTYNIVAANLSLGAGTGYATDCDGIASALSLAVRSAYVNDVLLTVAAGNDGDAEGVGFPACYSRVLAVANAYDANVGSSSHCTDPSCSTSCTDASSAADRINCSSNGGPLVALAAPGTNILAGGISMAGTSQAAPHVAGAGALVSARMPGSDVGDRMDWLVRSAHTVSDTRGTTARAYPRLDLETVFDGDAADLLPDSLVVIETGGDGDGFVEPGEAGDVVVTVENLGPGDLSGVSVTVAESDADVAFQDATATLDVDHGDLADARDGFSFTLAATCAADRTVDVTVAFDGTAAGTLPLELHCDVDDDGDGWRAPADCDDRDAAIHPDAAEVCDGRDNDCDGASDEGSAADATLWHADRDGDTFGDRGASIRACEPTAGWVADATDCWDRDPTVHPGAEDGCDGVDQDCDGSADEDGGTRWYWDGDGDGEGGDDTWIACDPPEGWVTTPGDCDDTHAGPCETAGCGCTTGAGVGWAAVLLAGWGGGRRRGGPRSQGVYDDS